MLSSFDMPSMASYTTSRLKRLAEAWQILLVAAVISCAGNSGKPSAKASASSDSARPLVRYGIPTGHEDEGCTLLVKSAYECFHSPRVKTSLWVAYRAEGKGPDSIGRPSNAFRPEPALAPDQRADTVDYRVLHDSFDYERGHLAPDQIIKQFGRDAQKETYSLANMTPQHSKTNGPIIGALEKEICRWSSHADPVWVITGPVFFGPETTWRGTRRVAIPDAYYMVLNRGTVPTVLSFLVRNDSYPPKYVSANDYLVSADSIEKLTGLDFLSELPDTIEDSVEAEVPAAAWR
jgi:endonuclease G